MLHFVCQRRMYLCVTCKQIEEDRKAWAAKLWPIEDVMKGFCCHRCCVSQKTLPVEYFEDTRKRFLQFNNQIDRKAFVVALKNVNSRTAYALGGGMFPICWTALRRLLGVSNCLLSSVAECPKAQSHCFPSRRVVLGFGGAGQGAEMRGIMSKGDVIEKWLHGLIDNFADYQPDSKEVHLPFGQKTDVFHLYTSEVEAGCRGLPQVSFSFFNKIWSQRVRHLKVRAFHRFAICNKCMEIQEELRKAKTDGDRRQWKEAKKRHVEYVRMERAMYHFRQFLCEEYGDAMSTVVDGADQQKYGLAYFAQEDKGVQMGYKYGVRHSIISSRRCISVHSSCIQRRWCSPPFCLFPINTDTVIWFPDARAVCKCIPVL